MRSGSPSEARPLTLTLSPRCARGEGTEARYADPYLAGVALGLVLLASFVFAGRGLGASGAFTRVVDAIAGQPQTDSWLVFEVAGVIAGGFASALLAGRIRREIERGPRISPASRLAFAFAGGAAMGVGAVLARGCTSGLALTGGALLSVGSWIFMLAAFASAYALAPLLRRAWR